MDDQLHPLAKQALLGIEINDKAANQSRISQDVVNTLTAALKENHDPAVSLHLVLAATRLARAGMLKASEQMLALARTGLSAQALDASMKNALAQSNQKSEKPRALAPPMGGGIGLKGKGKRS